MWSAACETSVIEQVLQLIKPIADWMQEEGLTDIPARCREIRSLYYLGFRKAVMQQSNADDCLAGIKPSLRSFFQLSGAR